ncbi:MAG TPA: hypothetical protein VFV78_07995, partial [Vicinamibacterales bacterium]|nr:hypothetical protein [Vicinamibacterales bacterium]
LPDGTDMRLQRRDTEYAIFAAGKLLMSSRMHGSEEAMAALACAHLRDRATARVLVGGLGMGYTLRATLDVLPATARVDLVEIQPDVVQWNRGPLGPLANHPLRDPRVHVQERDVTAALAATHRRFDAIILDVDNGPDAFTTATNAELYGDGGLAAIRRALRPDGTLAVWSAWEDRKFEQRLRYAGFRVRVEHVRARLKKGGPHHTIFLGLGASPPVPRLAHY